MNNFGIDHIWAQGDFVTLTVLVPLIFMSVLTWAISLYKLWRLNRLDRIADAVIAGFWSAPATSEGLQALGGHAGNPYAALVLTGRDASEYCRSGQGGIDRGQWIARCLKSTLDDGVAGLSAGVTVLGSIASTSPFIGLFGTVWGIFHALAAIGLSGKSGIEQVAGPVAEALVMTAFGLFVAIPAVLAYNAINRGNKKAAHKLARFANDLHAYFLTGARLAPPRASHAGAALAIA